MRSMMARDEPGDGSMLTQAAALRLTEAAMAAAAAVSAFRLRTAPRGGPREARARQQAMYLAHVVFGLTLTRVGIGFGRDRTTVRHACARIEDSRDDPRFELGLGALEAGLLALDRSGRAAARRAASRDQENKE